MSDAILLPGEIELYVQDITPSNIIQLGTPKWFLCHENLQKLNQQSVLEIGKFGGEVVKEMFISLRKLPVLVHEAICISVWKEKIFPLLLEMKEEPTTTFVPYMVLYHEAVAVALMETLLYYEDSCESLQDQVIDLIDYCVSYLTQLVTCDPVEMEKMHSEMAGKDELLLQAEKLNYDIGIRSISIIRYLSEYLESLPVSAAHRLYNTHDILTILIELIVHKPWKRTESGKTFLYVGGTWEQQKGFLQVKKTEGQTWLAIRQLLLGKYCLEHYEINDYRREQLLKILGYLQDTLIDQIPPLLDLKTYISKLSITAVRPPRHTPVLEMVPEIREAILKYAANKWEDIAQKQAQALFRISKEEIFELAKRFAGNFDMMDLSSEKDNICVNCRDSGSKRCSRCKDEWYCSRECQVKHWKKHKARCDLVVESKEYKVDF